MKLGREICSVVPGVQLGLPADILNEQICIGRQPTFQGHTTSQELRQPRNHAGVMLGHNFWREGSQILGPRWAAQNQ